MEEKGEELQRLERLRAYDQFIADKEEWERKKKESRKSEDGVMVLKSFEKYVSKYEVNGLMQDESFVKEDLLCITSMVRDMCDSLKDRLDSKVISSKASKKVSNYEVLIFESKIDSFGISGDLAKDKNLKMQLLFDVNRKYVRLLIKDDKNKNVIYYNQVFDYYTRYWFKLNSSNNSLEWDNLDVNGNYHGRWKLVINKIDGNGENNDSVVSQICKCLESFTVGKGLILISDEQVGADAGATLFDLDDSIANKKDLPSEMAVFDLVFNKLDFYQRIVLPSSIYRGYAFSMLNCIWLALNDFVSKSQFGSDNVNDCCDFLFYQFRPQIMEFLSSMNKAQWLSYKDTLEQEIKSVRNKKVKELLDQDSAYVDHMNLSLKYSCFFIRKRLKFGEGYNVAPQMGNQSIFNITSRASSDGKARCKYIAGLCDLYDILTLKDIDSRWWKYLSEKDFSDKVFLSFEQECRDCEFLIDLKQVSMDQVGKELAVFGQIAMKNGYHKAYNDLLKSLNMANGKRNKFIKNVLYFHLLFNKYGKSKKFYSMTLLLCKQLSTMCKDMAKNNNDAKAAAIFVFCKVQLYGACIEAPNGRNEILSAAASIKAALTRRMSLSPPASVVCDKTSQEYDWDEA